MKSNKQMTNIALVDDETNILTSVSLALETEGYSVDTFTNGEEALKGLENKKYDLGLFDIKMPRMNGNELLMKVRSSKNNELREMPIIFLTSKDQEQDEIIGLRMGAADYIKKPFSQKLLNERIRTVLRIHINRKNVDKETPIDKNLIKGDLILDDLKQLCFWKNNIIELTVAEFNLIRSLAKHPGVIKDRNQLMDAMYGDNIYVDDRTIDSHIKRLRKKFKSYDNKFDQIRTRYGSGYSWRE
ncbi:MAG: Alkaline phosphatase synthesis transcriptional regulatory protein PhoP [Alphaproteobacteria bacterium MarineAlpha5_Bin8]|nr:MAG: Alkaline phosphatase synthesis transcriptional regulatory protein PhoP [Alphaproteobacteria bacterium MarineAlpha5_Bin7]PPR46317.1 MAG: Alkaline phosphatase synthesis transcriptional regulatory protein PhoP [Alphaproteobacteria bacterium MarineAlpha5_Bin8]PPR54972.1 MAG: Alkaline phosphatase synthesis transcriptional regulatory protein PhoP [Alphaproteobacteria bacterium MarineAlpha5_Bin6]|tara:strand:- start:683 stop:1411 length:729 start_codon:yes stop_codon:yes gene_type:complete